MSESTGEVLPAVHTILGQAVQPGPSCSLQHERGVADCHTTIASCNSDCCQVIGQPIFGLHSTFVLGGISRQSEAFEELLRPNAMTETGWAGFSFFIFLSLLLQELNYVPCIILADLARAKSGADCWSRCRLLRQIIAPAIDGRFLHPSTRGRGRPIALDSALMPRGSQVLSILARCNRSLTSFRNRPHSSPRHLGSCRWIFHCC